MGTKIIGETFNLIPPQEMINFMLKYSIHKQVVQIPACVLVKKKLDFNTVKKAINIEIERNDCMRLRFFKEKGKFKQYFLDSYTIEDIPVMSFDSKETQDAYFTADAQNPIRYLKDETYRIRLFNAYDGRCGIYINVSHLCMDASAVFTFFADLFAIYDHMTIDTPMPKPLAQYKDTIKKELEYVADKDRIQADKEYYTEFFMKHGEPFYCGVHGPEFLEKEQKRKKNPNLRAPSAFDPIHDKAEMLKRIVPLDESKKIIDFCEQNGINYESLIQLGMRTHVSKINHRNPDVYFMTLCTRRATLNEKRCGGTMAEPLPCRTVITEDMTFTQALDEMRETQIELFRHKDYPYLECRELVRELFNYSPIAATSTMMFSWFPLEKSTMNGWDYEFTSFNLGRYVMPLYTFAMKDYSTGGLKFSYLYRTNMITAQNINDLHDKTIKALITAIDNPTITIGELLDTI